MRKIFLNLKTTSSQNITSAYAPKTITKDLCWCKEGKKQRPWGLKPQWGYEEDSVAVVLALRPKSNCTDRGTLSSHHWVIPGILWRVTVVRKPQLLWGVKCKGVLSVMGLTEVLYEMPLGLWNTIKLGFDENHDFQQVCSWHVTTWLTFEQSYLLSWTRTGSSISLISSTPYCYQPQQEVSRPFRFVCTL